MQVDNHTKRCKPVALKLNIHKRLAGFTLRVEQEISLQGVLAIFGASGAGKSTLLRAIAGLDIPASGHIALDDTVLYDHDHKVNIAPHLRGLGYMRQDCSLFEHLSVKENLEYALKRAEKRKISVSRPEFTDVIKEFDIEHLLTRNPKTLSGGETKRVALARILLSGPKLLLLDEPLSGLDVHRKREILPLLKTISKKFDIPLIYVSHDIDEVSHLADQMLVLNEGQMTDIGPVESVINKLGLGDPAGFYDYGTLLTGKIVTHDETLKVTTIALTNQPKQSNLTVPLSTHLKVNSSVRLRILSRDVALASDPPKGISIQNILAGTAIKIETAPDSAFAEVFIQLDGLEDKAPPLRSRVTLAAVKALELTKGAPIFALVKSVSFDGQLS